MLPKIKQPIFTLEIPSSKRKIKYRPFTVAEEKLLLIAKESSEQEDIINVYKQIINNCILDDININKLAYFDIEYIFVCLRAKSVSNVIDLTIEDEEDGKKHKLQFDLDTVYVSENKVSPIIELDGGLKIVLKYPDFETLGQMSLLGGDSNQLLNVITKCLHQIVEGEQVYELSNYNESEISDFVSSIGSKDLLKIQEFFVGLPQVSGELKYTNSLGQEKVVPLRGIQSFFV
jgi:hypothetical protein